MRPRDPRLGAALAVTLALLPACATADEISALRLAVGVFEWNLHPAAAGELAVQYRGGLNTGPLHPIVGGKVTTDAAAFVFAGFGVDVKLGRRFVLRPSFAPGFYRQGRGKDLGAVPNYRTAIEVALRLDGGRRLGLEVDHISNAGSAPTNPGEESIVLTFSFPLGKRGPGSLPPP